MDEVIKRADVVKFLRAEADGAREVAEVTVGDLRKLLLLAKAAKAALDRIKDQSHDD